MVEGKADTGTRSRHGEVEFERCLSFTIGGPWGHFRRVEGNIVKQTYRVIPRTTVAGLVAGMLGISRDEYYELFAPDSSAIAVEPLSELRTINMPMNTLSTAPESMTTLNARGSITISFPDSTQNRQQHNYEVLVEPEYRVDLWIEDEETYEALKRNLKEGKSHYIPSLGLSEYLAEVDYLGEFEVHEKDPDDVVRVASTVPNDRVVPEEGSEFRMEKPPAYMEKHGQGRRTTAFVSYSYNPEGEHLKVRPSDIRINEVDGRQVVFV